MKKINWKKVIGVFVLITLFISIIYSVYQVIVTPGIVVEGEHNRSDYVLMLIQCILGMIVFWLPSVLEKRLSFDIPNYMEIAYFIFLYCAIYLGEVHNFYYVIPNWDNILHCFSGAMLGAFGFTLVRILNDSEKVSVVLSPVFICLFAFCFAVTVGAMWEIYEFTGDSLFGLNMQKFRLADGTELVGSAALKDTMDDIIIDSLGALIVSVSGYISMILNGKYREYKERKSKENDNNDV